MRAVAETLGRTEAAVPPARQPAPARMSARPGRAFRSARRRPARLADGLHGRGRAAATWPALSSLLAEDAVLVTDGGGKRKAALRLMVGRDDIIALISGLAWRGSLPMAGDIRLARINGAFGVVLQAQDDVVTIAFEPGPDGRFAAIYIVRNPEKLGHVARGLARHRGTPGLIALWMVAVRFDERFLDEIKSRLRLSDVIGKTVKLRRQGREYVGLSPFTKEKTPSFFVNDDKGFFDFSSRQDTAT